LKLAHVIDAVQAVSICQVPDLEAEVRAGLSADLMSDVLRLGRERMLLITGLVNPQVVRTAEMLGITAVLFVRAKRPPPETIALAEEAGIALLATRYTMYEASGLLYQAGLVGIGPYADLGG